MDLRFGGICFFVCARGFVCNGSYPIHGQNFSSSVAKRGKAFKIYFELWSNYKFQMIFFMKDPCTAHFFE